MSRSRGSKAQQRRNHQYAEAVTQTENTIDFRSIQERAVRRPINLVPKSLAQEKLILSLQDLRVPITITVGPAGTGKSYLTMLAALNALRQGRVDKVVLTRPAVGVEDEKHGFLPGDLNKKMEPWTRPLLDVIKEFYHPREVTRMIEDEIIEISPLAFMRGRTFKNAYIVADEMQNATPNQTKMLLTRIGQHSKIVVNGDIEQTDKHKDNNGLLDLVTRLNAYPVAGIQACLMGSADIQRHEIIGQVLNLYNR